jgi:hypothetical protein
MVDNRILNCERLRSSDLRRPSSADPESAQVIQSPVNGPNRPVWVNRLSFNLRRKIAHAIVTEVFK